MTKHKTFVLLASLSLASSVLAGCGKDATPAAACAALEKAGYAKGCHPVTTKPSYILTQGSCTNMTAFTLVDAEDPSKLGMACTAADLHAADSMASYSKGVVEAMNETGRNSKGRLTKRWDDEHVFVVQPGNIVLFLPRMKGLDPDSHEIPPEILMRKVLPNSTSYVPHIFPGT